MLYLFHGADTEKSKEKARSVAGSLRARSPNAPFFVLDKENWSAGKIGELVGERGLFAERTAILVDGLLADETIAEAILKKIGEISASGNIFIFLEGKCKTETVRVFQKNGAKIQEFKISENGFGKKDRFNIFSLGDALGRRDKINLWILLQKALAQGCVAEEIAGTLFWQVKSMITASLTKSAEETEMKPYVFAKSKNYARNYSKEEMSALSSKIIDVYHASRTKGLDMEVALERFILDF